MGDGNVLSRDIAEDEVYQSSSIPWEWQNNKNAFAEKTTKMRHGVSMLYVSVSMDWAYKPYTHHPDFSSSVVKHLEAMD